VRVTGQQRERQPAKVRVMVAHDAGERSVVPCASTASDVDVERLVVIRSGGHDLLTMRDDGSFPA
jgi:hypothetical protein